MGHNSRLIKSLKSQKMKIFATLAAFALAQDGPDGRAMSLNKKIENAQNKCSVYMSKAYSCAPPSEKIGKYTFRLDKVLLDAKHHLKVGKCDVGGGYGGGNYRRKRETQEELEAEFDAVMAEINSNEGGFQGQIENFKFCFLNFNFQAKTTDHPHPKVNLPNWKDFAKSSLMLCSTMTHLLTVQNSAPGKIDRRQ